MHSSMAIYAWLQDMRFVSAYTLADAQEYSNRCMPSGHAFSVCTRWLMHSSMVVDVWLQAMRLVSFFMLNVCVYAG